MTQPRDNMDHDENPGGGAARTYYYNPSDLQHLFVKIIESLGSHDQSGDVVGRILSDVCRHFKFGCGFVYEADHTRTFHLREKYTDYAAIGLPESFQLDKHLEIDEVNALMKSAVFYKHSGDDVAGHGKTRIFDSSSFMLVPVQDDNNTAIGLVGMMDRRHNILLDDMAVHAAKMVLNLIANHVKLRLFQRNLEYARQSLMSILDNTGIDVYVNDFNTHEILYINKSMAAPYGGIERMMGKKCWQALYDDKTEPCQYCPQKELVDAGGNLTKIHSWDYLRPFDGAWFRVLSAAFRWVDGRLAHVVSSVDITENKKNEATIARMANYDALTNLPNRRKLMNDCEEAMHPGGRPDGRGYLLFFDLDDFKKLNDGMGHQAGDQLLFEVGKELQQNPLTANHCYRHSGDEFVLLFADAGRGQVREAVDFLLGRFQEPWRLDGVSPVCRASIGVAEFPANGSTPEELLHSADMMMYKAKRNGRGSACFCDGEIVRPADGRGSGSKD